MDGEEELLDLGGRRIPRAVSVGLVLVAVAALITYFAVQDNAGHHPVAATSATAGPSSPASNPVSSNPVSSDAVSSDAAADRPPWPQRPSACGGTSFLPLVSAAPLDQRTGVRAVVGDRLASVDLDTGRQSPAAGRPNGRYATDLTQVGTATYALLHSCDATWGAPTQVVRLDSSGRVRVLAHGPYVGLIGGGTHVWALLSDADGVRFRLDALDGRRPVWTPAGFAPLGAFRSLVVGTVPTGRNGPTQRVTTFDPATARTTAVVGRAGTAIMGRGVVVWTPAGCHTCRVHVLDLTTGRDTTSRRPVPGLGTAWLVAVSPGGRTAAFLRPGPTASRFDMGHPGNPNELVTLDLASGALRTVPGVTLWAKAMPGLAFSPDGRWLVIALDEGNAVRLLVWRPGLARPFESPVRLRQPVAYQPTIVPVG